MRGTGVRVFTGIVEELGEALAVESVGSGEQQATRLRIQGDVTTRDAQPGDSLAVNGVCLTVVAAKPVGAENGTRVAFTADVMRETLNRSDLGTVRPGDPVNLERPLSLASRLGGHMVQGHVDATGEILERIPAKDGEVMRFSLPRQLARYVAPQGSIAVDGVSLTVVEVIDPIGQSDFLASFTVSLIPTTLTLTTLGRKRVGNLVNLEVDVIAKYVERLLGPRLEETEAT